MAKKRRTLEQKKQADLRRHQPISQSPSSTQTAVSPTNFTYSLQNISSTTTTINKSTPPPLQRASTIAVSYQYAFGDLRKTFLTTLAIVLAQIILFLVVKK